MGDVVQFSESRVSEPALWIRALWAAFEQLDREEEEEEHDPTLKDKREEYSRNPRVIESKKEVMEKIKELKDMRTQLELALRLGG